MIYAPHTLYKKQRCEMRVDKFGKPLPPTYEWIKVGRCRCDDDRTVELESDNGQHYKSHYHVVYNRSNFIEAGDEVKCIDANGDIRGKGVAGMVKSTNYLTYSELWM